MEVLPVRRASEPSQASKISFKCKNTAARINLSIQIKPAEIIPLIMEANTGLHEDEDADNKTTG